MSSGIATLCPAWSIPGYLEVRDDHLTVNGVDTIELVKEFNSPLFVFSEGRIRDNITRLQRAADAVDRPIKFFYASKANSNMAILKVVLESGIDIEVNSGGELFKALRVGFRPDQIIFNGTSKSDDEMPNFDVNSAVCKPRCERVPISGTRRNVIRAAAMFSPRARRRSTDCSTKSIS